MIDFATFFVMYAVVLGTGFLTGVQFGKYLKRVEIEKRMKDVVNYEQRQKIKES